MKFYEKLKIILGKLVKKYRLKKIQITEPLDLLMKIESEKFRKQLLRSGKKSATDRRLR